MPPVEGRLQIYNAEIVAGSLLVPESRKIVRLLLDHAEKDTWHNSIKVKNILQKRTPATAERQTKLIRKVKTITGKS